MRPPSQIPLTSGQSTEPAAILLTPEASTSPPSPLSTRSIAERSTDTDDLPEQYISPTAKEEFQALVQGIPLYSFKDTNQRRKLTYSRQKKLSSTCAERINGEGVRVVGFDLEWKPMYNNDTYNLVSLVQIASHSEVLLVQLDQSTAFPPGLQALLEDPTILKVGAGIRHDVQKLSHDWNVNVQAILDLADFARYVDPFWNTCDRLRNQVIEGAFGGGWCDQTNGDTADALTDQKASRNKSLDISQVKDIESLSKYFKEVHVTATAERSSPSSQQEATSNTTVPTTPPPLSRSQSLTYPPTPLTSDSDQEDPKLSGQLPLPDPTWNCPVGKPISLARLVARYQGKRLDKAYQLSNWAAPLNKKQIEYAANDGCAGLDIFNTLIRLSAMTPGWQEKQAARYKALLRGKSPQSAVHTRKSMSFSSVADSKANGKEATKRVEKRKSATMLKTNTGKSSESTATTFSSSLDKTTKPLQLNVSVPAFVPKSDLSNQYPSPPSTPTKGDPFPQNSTSFQNDRRASSSAAPQDASGGSLEGIPIPHSAPYQPLQPPIHSPQNGYPPFPGFAPPNNFPQHSPPAFFPPHPQYPMAQPPYAVPGPYGYYVPYYYHVPGYPQQMPWGNGYEQPNYPPRPMDGASWPPPPQFGMPPPGHYAPNYQRLPGNPQGHGQLQADEHGWVTERPPHAQHQGKQELSFDMTSFPPLGSEKANYQTSHMPTPLPTPQEVSTGTSGNGRQEGPLVYA
ncbi:hypothetical protein CPB86DRAFT_814032 [Serendipita vermifera]|nr:hypothetical protein CPB86DRAFT_814032 [Serendipita vermifera]